MIDSKVKPRILLGSSSPRRKDLLLPHGHLRILPADIDETPKQSEVPSRYVCRMAKEKFECLVTRVRTSEILVTADTAVVLGRDILGKPQNQADAKRMLLKLSGCTHEVLTAFCVGHSKPHLIKTKVRFRSLSAPELASYLRGKEWQGKAGAYAIQGQAISFIAHVHGSLTSVVGLPVAEVLAQIKLFQKRR